MNFCVDCKHWTPPSNVHNELGDCNHPELVTEKTCLITGNISRSVGMIAEWSRYDADFCGTAGKWWEAKTA